MLRACVKILGRGAGMKTCRNVCPVATNKQINRQTNTDNYSRALSTTNAEDISGKYDVVVIGGGIAGCTCLYYLTKLGVNNVILLEANQITSGTTWHTAGLCYRIAKNDMITELHKVTYDLLNSLERETGVNPGYVESGCMFIVSKYDRVDERLAGLERLVTYGKSKGIKCDIIEPTQIKLLAPLLDTSQIVAAFYTPQAGSMDPSGVCEGLTRGATRAGAKVVENCAVTGITTEQTLLGGSKITQVQTQNGTITTNVVVNATGGWGSDISSMVGRTLPLQVFKHGYIVTGTIQGAQNMPVVRDYSASCYYKPQGDSMVIGHFEYNPIPIDKLKLDNPFALYEPDWDIFSGILKGASRSLPVLQNAGIKSTIYGPESFTPDNNPILGEDAEIQGLYYSCGYNSHGMQQSGGCGEQIAKWIVDGKPSLDMFSFDVRRFDPRLVKDGAWVREKSHEGISKNYGLIFPRDEPLAGRRKKLSPLHQELEDNGCVFQEKYGWEMPGWFQCTAAPVPEYDWYGAYNIQPTQDLRYINALNNYYTFHTPKHIQTLKEECLSCREKGAIFDLTSFGKFLLTGPDAEAAAEWVFSARVSRRKPGSTFYTSMLNHKAGVEADLTVSVCENKDGTDWQPSYEGTGFYIITGVQNGEHCRAHIINEARNHGWNIQLRDLSEKLAILSVQGPNSRNILQGLTDESLTDNYFPYCSHKIITVAGHKCRIFRISHVGELGYELHIPNSSALSLYHAIKSKGKNLGLIDAGFVALHSLSLEKGYRHSYANLSEDTPLEAASKLKTDIDFLGRSTLIKQQDSGIEKRLVTLSLDTSRPLWGNEPIKRNGETVGVILSTDYAFYLDKILAYGYTSNPKGGKVTTDFLNTGKWEIVDRLQLRPATLHLTHPFDPHNKRLKGIYN